MDKAIKNGFWGIGIGIILLYLVIIGSANSFMNLVGILIYPVVYILNIFYPNASSGGEGWGPLMLIFMAIPIAGFLYGFLGTKLYKMIKK